MVEGGEACEDGGDVVEAVTLAADFVGELVAVATVLDVAEF